MIFETGVSDYVRGTITIPVSFPIDDKGVPHVRCALCRFFSRTMNRCNITGSVIPWPERYIGVDCPVRFDE